MLRCLGRRAGWRRLARFLAHRPGLIASILVVAVVLVAAFAPGALTSANPIVGIPADRLRPPSAQHLFGTDQLGRDLFARVVHGAALSLRTTMIAVAVGLVAGSAIGLVTGFAGGPADEIIMRVVDVLLAIPSLLLSLALVTALGVGTVSVAVAVGVPTVANFARVMRAETLRLRGAVFVEAARCAGVRWGQVLSRHVLPHACGPVTALAALEFGAAILTVSGLSFLGYGAAPPTPEWGSLVANGRNYLATSWWLSTLPGLTITLTVLATNRIARALDGEWARAW
ncbi:ABC transporter permease [Protofrankia coriariae]|uniref:ABC transporter permease n=1 Tax=Protofrankia coriariae TaxID=1562887 RepID=UPI000640625A|nr:ABC transporter permease [Protofrankia coriariae]